MRIHLLALILMAGVAMPAHAQQNVPPAERIDRRVGKLEQEMRAVQRRVFPGGNVEPEIRPDTEARPLPGVPASSAFADLTARVDALEGRLATLTGQIEQNQNRVRQLEENLARFRDSAQARLDAIEKSEAPAPRPTAPLPSTAPESDGTDAPGPAAVDAGQEAYNAGFRLWEQNRYAEAQRALEAMAKQYPKHRLASWANNLAGRAYLDDGKPATAAKILLANYQGNPRGERAADSLYFLGQALMALKKPVEACKVYDELQDVYGTTMRAFLKQRLPQARAAAKCK